MTDKILTSDEIAAIQLAFDEDRHDSVDLDALVESHEALRADRNAIDRRRAALSQTLVELRSAAGQAVENDQAGLRASIRAEYRSSTLSPKG
jgi:hypothetical protein